MDILLLAITVTSLVTAIGSSVFAWRLLRDDHDRSDARIAQLTADIEAADTDAVDLHAQPGETASAALFTEVAGGTGSRVGWVPGLLAGLVLLVGIAGTFALSRRGADAVTAHAGSATPSLELLSLRHAADKGELNVTGLVRNPSGANPMQRVAAVVFTFDSQGSFIASGRAPLDFATLAPGEESPFVVRVSTPPGVARYRVSFRQDEGGLIPHLDRREVKTP